MALTKREPIGTPQQRAERILGVVRKLELIDDEGVHRGLTAIEKGPHEACRVSSRCIDLIVADVARKRLLRQH